MEERIEKIKRILYFHVGAVNSTDADMERCAKEIARKYCEQSEIERLESIIEAQRDAICNKCRDYHRLLDEPFSPLLGFRGDR
jgi:hypothetical protein